MCWYWYGLSGRVLFYISGHRTRWPPPAFPPQSATPPAPPVSPTTPSAWAVCRAPHCIMGSAFPSAQLSITRTAATDAEVGTFFCEALAIFKTHRRFESPPPLLLRLPRLLRLLLGLLSVAVLLLSRWASPPPGPVCGGLRGEALPPGRLLPQ